MDDSLKFLVRGSGGNAYEVDFRRYGNNLTGTCTCSAGQMGKYCKHLFALIEGEVTNLLSENTDDVYRLNDMITGTDVEAAIEAVRIAEKELSSRKKALALAMRDYSALRSRYGF